jgi:WD40 repeat protein
MSKILLLSLLILLSAQAKDIKPITTIQTSGLVSDFVEDKGYLYVATDAGVVDIIDLSSQKIVRQIKLEPLLTSRGDFVPARIHCVDRKDGKTLLVSSGISAYRNVWVDDGKKLTKILDETEHLMPKSAFFSDDNKILLGTFGSDVVLYDNEENAKLYERQISESTMGGMVLSEDKKKMIVSDESGEVRVIEVNSSKVTKTFSSEHVDNIYRVAYANHIIITAGQDRRVGVYHENGKAYHIKSDFLVYAVGLSPNGETGVYSSGLEHHLQLFDTNNGNKGNRLVGHYAIPNKILFINETSLISSGDEEKIFFWKLEK